MAKNIDLTSKEYIGDTPREVIEWRLSAYCKELEGRGRQIKELEAQAEEMRASLKPIIRKRDVMAAALQLLVREQANLNGEQS